MEGRGRPAAPMRRCASRRRHLCRPPWQLPRLACAISMKLPIIFHRILPPISPGGDSHPTAHPGAGAGGGAGSHETAASQPGRRALPDLPLPGDGKEAAFASRLKRSPAAALHPTTLHPSARTCPATLVPP